MSVRHFFLLGFILAIAGCREELPVDIPKDYNDWFEYDLRGPVYQVTEYSYDTAYNAQGELIVGDNLWQIMNMGPLTEFNKDGMIVEEYFDRDAATYGIWTYRYRGDKIETVTKLNEDRETIGTIVNEFKNGEFLKRSVFDSIGDLSSFAEFEYQEDGKVEIIRFYDQDGTIERSVKTIMDEDNFVMEEQELNAEGDQQSRVVYNMDQYKRDTLTLTYDELDSLEIKTSYKYDKLSFLIEHKEAHVQSDSIAVYTFTHATDHHLNWIYRVVSLNGAPYYIQKRTIDYFGESHEPFYLEEEVEIQQTYE